MEPTSSDERARAACGAALRQARSLLQRFGDPFTRAECDDLAQETAMAVWQFLRGRRERIPVHPVVLTIAPRIRRRAVDRQRRQRTSIADFDLEEWPECAARDDTCLRVGGVLVPREWLLARLATVMPRLGDTNRCIVLAYYGGLSCAELGKRCGMSERVVRVRLHRGRALLRRELEAMTRAAGHFEP